MVVMGGFDKNGTQLKAGDIIHRLYGFVEATGNADGDEEHDLYNCEPIHQFGHIFWHTTGLYWAVEWFLYKDENDIRNQTFPNNYKSYMLGDVLMSNNCANYGFSIVGNIEDYPELKEKIKQVSCEDLLQRGLQLTKP